MRCRGLQRLANPPYLGRFVISGLLSVALYCIPGGVRVVSIAPLYSLRQRLPRVDSTSFFARHPRHLSPCPPQPLASPSDATPTSCRGSADALGLGRIPPRCCGRLWTRRDCPERPRVWVRACNGPRNPLP